MPPPIRATQLVEGHSALPGGPVVHLPFDDRHRRRHVITATDGEALMIDLPRATHLNDGARLLMDDGRVLTVRAADEEVVDITAPSGDALARLAYHLGNRHTPVALLPGRLRMRRDHVLEAMVERLGGTARACRAPFDPEPGAYHDGHGSHHGHDH